jgi:ABC-type branched-subunit amino acid transport system substrate-binding protein/predicted negative regulator of RcsB-dependent stress response
MKISPYLKLVFLFLLLPLLPQAGWAQSQQELETRFQNAKVLVDQQKHQLAMKELASLTTASPQNPFAADASYLYAYAALQAGNLQEADLMLQQLLTRHPAWIYTPDALYLRANVAFQRQQYEQALQTANQIKAKRLAGDVRGLKLHHLGRLTEKDQFQALLPQFPEDRELHEVYADKLVAGWYTDQDQPILENIVSRFKLDRERYLNRLTARKKEYNVAVMLPFQLQQTGSAALKRNQFIADLYAGIKMAQDSLARQKIKINLFTYDTGADTVQVKKTLELPEIATMDLIIGPIYKSTSRVVARYAAERQIMNINPLSQDLDLATNNPFLLLFESSIATQARQAAEYAFQTFSPKTAVIIFENTRDDTVYARHYRQHFTRLGGKVQLYHRMDSPRSANISDIVAKVKLEELGHLAIFSNSQPLAVNTISMLEGRQLPLPVLVPGEWLEIQQVSLTQLDNNEIYFLYPKYVDASSPIVRHFRRAYLNRYNIPPSVYAYNGFEMMYYFGSMLQQFGPRFNLQLPARGYSRGIFLQGISYTRPQGSSPYANDNQFVPILKLENLQPYVVNREQ